MNERRAFHGQRRRGVRRNMKRFVIAWILTALILSALNCAAEEVIMSAYVNYIRTGEAPSLAAAYEGLFSVGLAVSQNGFTSDAAKEIIKANFNSLTCENEMKADYTMDYAATLKQGDDTRIALNLTRADKALSFAQNNGMRMRGHTLVWHSQVPRWFFTIGYQKSPEAPLAPRETILARMENYIRDLMAYVNTNYPGIIYAWDVVNEAIEPANEHALGYRTNGNLWYETLGDDFIELAFTFARRYADPAQKLFYNDYNCYDKGKLNLIQALLKSLRDKGLVDGMGLQTHIDTNLSMRLYEEALLSYASLGLTLHATELDIKTEDASPEGQMKLAVMYKRLFSMYKRLNEEGLADISNVTMWGVVDSATWLNNTGGGGHTYYPLLFNGDYTFKAAYFGALLDPAIPESSASGVLKDAVEALKNAVESPVP